MSGRRCRLATAAAEVLETFPRRSIPEPALDALAGLAALAESRAVGDANEYWVGVCVAHVDALTLVGARRLRLEAGPRPGTARSARGAERAERAERAVERAVEGDAEGAFCARPRGEGGGDGGEAIETGTGGAGDGAGGDDASTRIDRARPRRRRRAGLRDAPRHSPTRRRCEWETRTNGETNRSSIGRGAKRAFWYDSALFMYVLSITDSRSAKVARRSG